MSYGIMPYRVSLSRLRTRFGMTDKKKRSKTRGACYHLRQSVDELDSSENAPKFDEIVVELLDGKAEHSKYGYKYWYAVKGFVESIGQFLNNSEWYPADASVFWNSKSFKLYDIDAPMRIPTPDDSPTVFVLRAENMTDDLLKELEEKIGYNEQFWQVSSWIRDAKRYKQDLVLFYH
jgi:hypothetical protein